METRHTYHPALIGIHWATVLLIAAAYAFIELRDIFPKGTSAHDMMKTWHFMLGLTVFALVLVRIPVRLAFGAPPITPRPPVWQERLAGAMHLALYAFLIVMPVLGWLTLSAQGKSIPFALPALLAPDKGLGENLQDIHEFIGNLGYWLIGLHSAAALFHHYLLRDDTMRRMGFGRASKAGTDQSLTVNRP
jgi:cytochrome b561